MQHQVYSLPSFSIPRPKYLWYLGFTWLFVDICGSNGNLGQTWTCTFHYWVNSVYIVFSHNIFILQTLQWKSKVIQYHSHYTRHRILQVVCLKFSLCCGLAQAFPSSSFPPPLLSQAASVSVAHRPRGRLQHRWYWPTWPASHSATKSTGSQQCWYKQS